MNTANLYGTDMFIGTRVMNYKNVAGLSDSEFGEFYLGNMKDYDFWGGVEFIHCDECKTSIKQFAL